MNGKGDNQTLSPNTIYKVSAYTAGVVLLGGLFYFRSQSKKQERKAKEAILRAQRMRKRLEDKESKRKPKKVVLYFNKYDELIEEAIALSDPNNYYHKYHTVDFDFGADEQQGRDLLTKDIFYGQKKQENLQIFIENWEKNKQKHQKKLLEQDLWQSFDSEESEKSEKGLKENESVIMNLNPNKFEKPKDHLFFNFFSMYAKKSVDPQVSSARGNHFDGLAIVSEAKEDQPLDEQ